MSDTVPSPAISPAGTMLGLPSAKLAAGGGYVFSSPLFRIVHYCVIFPSVR